MLSVNGGKSLANIIWYDYIKGMQNLENYAIDGFC